MRNMPNYSIYCGSANDPELNTYPSQYGELTIVKLWNHRCSLEFRNDTKNLMWIGTYHELNEPYFKGWKQVAISESPQEFKLETAAGYKTYHGYKNQYSMNSFGEVTVIGCIRRDDESVFPEMSAEDNTIAVLPQGYRPNEWLSVGGVLRFPSVEPKPCLVFIKNTGEISALIGAGMANQYKVIEFHVTYVATK